MNASYSPKISIYNPESVMMQITEMYSSSPRLQITLGNMYNNNIDTLPTDCMFLKIFKMYDIHKYFVQLCKWVRLRKKKWVLLRIWGVFPVCKTHLFASNFSQIATT